MLKYKTKNISALCVTSVPTYLENFLVILWSIQSSISDYVFYQFLVVLWKYVNMLINTANQLKFVSLR